MDLDEALKTLSEPERLCVSLCHGAGMAHPEIATALNLPLGTVKSHVKRGLDKLRARSNPLKPWGEHSMSADEFDPAIERLFARTPTMPDAALFTAQVEQRMQKGSRVRVVVLGLAGLAGAVVAVREVVSVNVNLGEGGGSAATGMQGLEAVSFNAQTAIQSGLDQVGLGNLAFGSMSGMQMFWIAAGALICGRRGGRGSSVAGSVT